MLTITEIGEYSSKQGQVLNIYMVEHQGGTDGSHGKQEPAVTYYMDIDGYTEVMAWPDWQAFARKVNAVTQEPVLELAKDPAVELGIAVPVGMECPDCGNRIQDLLCPLETVENLPPEVEDEDILCDYCGTFYKVAP